jgi:hypothetical protein
VRGIERRLHPRQILLVLGNVGERHLHDVAVVAVRDQLPEDPLTPRDVLGQRDARLEPQRIGVLRIRSQRLFERLDRLVALSRAQRRKRQHGLFLGVLAPASSFAFQPPVRPIGTNCVL